MQATTDKTKQLVRPSDKPGQTELHKQLDTNQTARSQQTKQSKQTDHRKTSADRPPQTKQKQLDRPSDKPG